VPVPKSRREFDDALENGPNPAQKAITTMTTTMSPTILASGDALIRLYGPEKPVFDKTWTLPDVEIVKLVAIHGAAITVTR
jgi:hypothetical protein